MNPSGRSGRSMIEIPAGVRALLRPRSVAVVGASDKPNALGTAVVDNLKQVDFKGDLHFVSRTQDRIADRPCVAEISDLPPAVDVAILAIPAAALDTAIADCVRRQVRSAIVFASGYAETGEHGRSGQEAMATAAREGGLALMGPNCLGLVNFAAGIPLTFETFSTPPYDPRPGIAVLTQSGAMASNLQLGLRARGQSVSYLVATGNEAALGIEDFLAAFLDDPHATAFALMLENIRDPNRFLELARRAYANGKPIVLLHPGRSERAQAAAQTHTGVLVGNHAIMRALVTAEGVVMVETPDELFDVATMLARYPLTSPGNVAFMTNSGALRGWSLDYAESIGLSLATISAKTASRLGGLLPLFAIADNPLDLTTAGMRQPEIFGQAADALLDDGEVGSLVVALLGGSPARQVAKLEGILPVLERSAKPVALVFLGDGAALSPDATAMLSETGVPFFRSSERAMRALSLIEAMGRPLETHASYLSDRTPQLDVAAGISAEYVGKALVAGLGIPIPAGGLAKTLRQAITIAGEIGYPVVLKAQATALPHKSEAGAVILSIADDAALGTVWQCIEANVEAFDASIILDGMLVEKMSAAGVEMIVSVKRDPDWGPVLIAGLGGVLTEVLNDIRIFPVDASEAAIVSVLMTLKGSALLKGFRNSKSVDLCALSKSLRDLGQAAVNDERLLEIEINPLMIYPDGVLALDVLVCGRPTAPS